MVFILLKRMEKRAFICTGLDSSTLGAILSCNLRKLEGKRIREFGRLVFSGRMLYFSGVVVGRIARSSTCTYPLCTLALKVHTIFSSSVDDLDAPDRGRQECGSQSTRGENQILKDAEIVQN